MSRLGLLTLLLSPPVLAQEAEEPEVPALSAEARTEAMSSYLEYLQKGDLDGATDELLAMLDDETLADLHGEAYLNLAMQLEAKGFRVAALRAYTEAIARDGERTAPEMGRAVTLAKEVGHPDDLAHALFRQMGAPMSNDTRAAVSMMTARYHLQRDNLGEAAGLLYTVGKNSDLYADSRNLLGVVLTHQGRPDAALAPFAEAQAIGRAQERGDDWNNMLTLNLARAFFTAKNWTQSVYHYQQVERGSLFWPEAQFERSWAHFRADDMTGTLATLMSPDSPFFDDWYFAEAHLLRVYALFMMCKFPDASSSIDAFAERYEPMNEELAQAQSALDPSGAWAEVVAAREGSPTSLPSAVLRPFLIEERFSDAIRAVDMVDEDLKQVSSLQSDALAAQVTSWTEEARSEILDLHGERVLRHAQSVRIELDEMLEGVQMTRLDIINLEAQMYERAAATGSMDYGDPIGKLRDLKRRRSRSWVWPFEGEFWVDELGYYQIDARPDCPSGMAGGS